MRVNQRRDLYEALARAVAPKPKNRKEKGKLERKIQRMRNRIG